VNKLLAKNIIFMLLWQGSNYLVPLITLPYLARTLGAQAFGDVALSFAVVTYFMLVSDWGFGWTATQQISKSAGDRDLITKIFWDTMNAKLLIGGVSLLALAALTLSVPTLKAISSLISVAALVIIANIITVNWCLQGLERLDLFASGSVLGRLATVPLILLLVQGPGDAGLSILIQTGGLVLSGVFSLCLLARLKVVGRPVASLERTWFQILKGWPNFISSFVANLYTTGNIIILGMLTSSTSVGLYSGADKIRHAAQGVVSLPIGMAVFPRVSKLMHENEESAFSFIRHLLVTLGLITFLISSCLFLLARPLVELLLGHGFLDAIPILQCLAWLPFVTALNSVLGPQVLLQIGKQTEYSRIIVGALLVALATIFPLVTMFGALGAAISALITEMFAAVTMAVVAFRAKPVLFLQRKQQ
jgi:polysaccharide transporter, PST family